MLDLPRLTRFIHPVTLEPGVGALLPPALVAAAHDVGDLFGRGVPADELPPGVRRMEWTWCSRFTRPGLRGGASPGGAFRGWPRLPRGAGDSEGGGWRLSGMGAPVGGKATITARGTSRASRFYHL